MTGTKNINSQTSSSPYTLQPRWKNRLQFCLTALVVIFVAEALLMVALSFLPSMPTFSKALLDALLLVIIIFLIFWPQLKKEMIFQNNRYAEILDTLSKSEGRYKALVESTEDSIYLVNRQYCYVFMNQNHLARLGCTSEEFLGRPYSDFHSEEETRRFETAIDKVFAGGKSIQQEHQSVRDGSYFLRTLSPVRGDDGLITSVSVISKKITGLKKMEEELRKLSITDELTGLYNRRGFITFGEQQIKLADRLNRELLLITADLDDLKNINDTWGHQEGDQALAVVATILMDTFRSSDIIARIGGDEFVALQMKNPENFLTISSNRLKETLDNHNARSQKPYKISLSLGSVVYNPEQPVALEELLAAADAKMYEQKKLKNSNNSG